ncbi:UPF0187-domain-containing protein [Phlegmacium glaucopus]|nr:UPF0187-domain-containing protein [Phlegmacium glaucopus]
MVASNPLFRGGLTLKKFEATVINDIWPEVTFFTLIATMVSLVSSKTSHHLGVPTTLLTVLGTVLGLVISFRTSSAYERYQDGRKMWTNIITASRNLSQQIWIHVPVDRPKGGEASRATALENIIEKKTMINLIIAFSVSVKHFLRDERGPYYEDLYPLISFLPKYANGNPDHSEKLPIWHEDDGDDGRMVDTPATELGRDQTPDSQGKMMASMRARNGFDPEKALPRAESEHDLKPARNPPTTSIFDLIPLLRFFKWLGHKVFRMPHSAKHKRKKAYIEYVESNIPLEIILVLSNYTAWCMRYQLISPAIATGLTANLTSLQDTLSNLERICNTPLPFAYQAHLRMSLWIYLFFLPFQLWISFGFITIPATAFTSFLLLGFLEIGQEIENPFNYDLNDLDLDYFCSAIQRELHLITAHTNPNPSEFIFTALNKPFAPSDQRSALELTESDTAYQLPDKGVEPGLASIRRTLVKGWKDVNSVTRQPY